MKVKILKDGWYGTPGIVGAVVKAVSLGSGYNIAASELSIHDAEWLNEPQGDYYFFLHNEVEVVEE